MYSYDPLERIHDSPLSMAAGDRYRSRLEQGSPSDAEMRNVADMLKATFDSSAHLLGAVRQVAGAWMGRGGALAVPWLDVPGSTINTKVDGARRFVAQTWPFERIRAIGRAMDGTFNDAVMAICAGALRLFLQNHGELPDKSLKAMVPVSLRKPGDLDSANAVGAISVDLATNVADPAQRMRQIQASAVAGKAMYADMSAGEAALFAQLTQLPGLLLIPLGLGSRFPPYSTVISNVPGPRQPMYWNGARLEGVYPASIVTEGIAMNITLVSYDKQVDLGIMACRRSLPHVQRFIDYMEDALVELEDAAGIGAARPADSRTPAAVKTKSKPRSKATTRAKKKARPGSVAKPESKVKPGKNAAVQRKAGLKVKPKTKVKAKAKVKAKVSTRQKARPKRR
jgi:WS/DGAT/MGAT family acyltransferase